MQISCLESMLGCIQSWILSFSAVTAGTMLPMQSFEQETSAAKVTAVGKRANRWFVLQRGRKERQEDKQEEGVSMMAAADTSRKVVCRQLDPRDTSAAAPQLHQPCRPHPHHQRSLIPNNHQTQLVGVRICWREFAFGHFRIDVWLIFPSNPRVTPNSN